MSNQLPENDVLLRYAGGDLVIRVRTVDGAVSFALPEVAWKFRFARLLKSPFTVWMLLCYFVGSNASTLYRQFMAGTLFTTVAAEKIVVAVVGACLWTIMMAAIFAAFWNGCLAILITDDELKLDYGGSVRQSFNRSDIHRIVLTPLTVMVHGPRRRWYNSGQLVIASGFQSGELRWLAKELSSKLGVPLKVSVFCSRVP
jgi:hypothetical protein